MPEGLDNAPATKADLNDLGVNLRAEMQEIRADLRTEISEVRTDLRTEMHEIRIELLERLEQSETTLLKEFRKWAVRIESTSRVHDARSIGLDQRLAVLEERVTDLEDRK